MTMVEPPADNPSDEARLLVRALRAHVMQQLAAGAEGLPRAETGALAPRLTEPPPSQQPSSLLSSSELGAPVLPRLTEPPPSQQPSSPLSSPGPRPGFAKEQRAAFLGETPPAVSAPRSVQVPIMKSASERQRELVLLEERVKSCKLCKLAATRTQTVFGRGTAKSGLCFVGEGPGADEDARGEPFVGKAGQLLDRMIAAMGLLREEIYICNIVKCRPPENRKPEPDEVQACRAYLTEQLELLAPKVIVALGATAVQGLLGLTGGITQLRGQWRLYRGAIPVMPTFHPAYLLRNPPAKRPVWEDMLQVLERMGRTPPARPEKV